jgi:hypothetical protein
VRLAGAAALCAGLVLGWRALAAPGASAPPVAASGLAAVTAAARMVAPASAPATQAAPPASQPASAPARPALDRRQIGLLSPARCLAMLDQAGVPYRRENPRSGVVTPIRLTGPVGGVTYRGQGRKPEASPFSIMDCRLAVALIALSDIMREHEVVEVGYYSIHRSRNRGSRARSGGRTGHRGGLAIDVNRLVTRDGRNVSVYDDFKGRRRAAVCGADADPGATDEAQLLRAIVCDSDEQRLFHVLLTPNHDRAHRNHFHMEVRPDGARWFLLR